MSKKINYFSFSSCFIKKLSSAPEFPHLSIPQAAGLLPLMYSVLPSLKKAEAKDVQRLYFLSIIENAYHQAAHAEAAGPEPYDEPGQLAIDEHEHDFYY